MAVTEAIAQVKLAIDSNIYSITHEEPCLQ